MRQIGKQILTIGYLLLAMATARGDALVTTIVTDPLTGVAIDGFDPVTYFTDSAPQPGHPEFEYDWNGVPWYFISAANRDVFVRAPEVYAPQYGGYGVMSLSRGYLSDGKPVIYAVEGQKLYLFYSSANREAFFLSRAEVLTSAAANWPKLSAGLLGPKAEEVVSGALVDGASVAPDAADANLAAN